MLKNIFNPGALRLYMGIIQAFTMLKTSITALDRELYACLMKYSHKAFIQHMAHLQKNINNNTLKPVNRKNIFNLCRQHSYKSTKRP